MTNPDVTELLTVMQKQHQEQMMEHFSVLLAKKEVESSPVVLSAAPSFVSFDLETELWTDYWTRFEIFVKLITSLVRPQDNLSYFL